MDSWYQPSRARYSPPVGGIPVKACRPKPTNTSSPKIISIPVRFVGSETTRSESALKIQKVFRGYLVRKSIKRIMAINNQVEEIERRLLKNETIELIRKDTKERLRVNETLMALLFKLDSIRGVYPGIRDCRKAVIKKAVTLQEKVDCIVASPDQPLVSAADRDEEVDVDMDNSTAVAESDGQTLEMKEMADDLMNLEDGRVEAQRNALDAKNYGCLLNESCVDFKDNVNRDQQPENAIEMNPNLAVPREIIPPNSVETEGEEVAVDSVAENCEKMDIREVGVHSGSDVNGDEEPCVVKEITEDCNTIPYVSEHVEEKDVEADAKQKLKEQSAKCEGGGEEYLETGRAECGGSSRTDDRKGNRELLERMVGENEKMMRMMSQLCERNEMQTRMLTSLTQRVERLEKAFICDKLRKKKKNKTKHTTIPN